MPSFLRLELWSKLACQGGATKLGVLHATDLAAAKDIESITDQESLTFAFTRVDRTGAVRPIVAPLVARTIATIVWDDGSFDERRVSLIDDGQGVGGLISVTANPLILDLAEGADSAAGKGLVSDVSGVLRVFAFSAMDVTATDLWDTYIIPACPAWVSRGTIDPSVKIPSITWDRLTPQALAIQVRDTLIKMQQTCELRLRRNGTTDYQLDLVTQVGAGATVPLFHPRTSLESLKRRIDTTQMATRLFVTGETDPSGVAGIPGRARWVVTNVSSLTLTLADQNGGAGPIGVTNQWASPAWLVRTSTGRTFPIQSSDAAAQTVTLLSVSTIAVGETVELRLTEPETNTRGTALGRVAVTSIGGSEYVAVTGGVAADGEWTDWYARVWTAAVAGSVRKDIRITTSIAATQRLECTPGDATGVLLTDYVELVQLDGAGEIPSYLEHPAALAAYGAKVGDLAVTTRVGVTQLVPNNWMRTWSNPTNPPDDWTINGSGTFTSQNTNPDFTRYGGASFHFDYNAAGGSPWITSPRTDHVFAPGNDRLSCRAQIYMTDFAGGSSFDVRLVALQRDGTYSGSGFLGRDIVLAAAGTGAWITAEVIGVVVNPSSAPYGVGVVLFNLSGNVNTKGYLDTVEIFGFVANPTGIYEFGDATVLHQAGNQRLVANGPPPIAYELTVADLERSDPATWARNALTVGGNVRAVDAELGVDTTVRLLRLERDLLRPKASVVGLATLPPLLTQVAQTV